MIRSILASAAAAALLVSAGCTTTSTLTFRSPDGSQLRFLDGGGQVVGQTSFPGQLELVQFASPGDDPKRRFDGTLRLNELVEEDRIPSKARRYLIDEDEGVSVKVRGYYLVYSRSGAPAEDLAVYHVDVPKEGLLKLLSGSVVQVDGKSAAGEQVFALLFGLDAR